MSVVSWKLWEKKVTEIDGLVVVTNRYDLTSSWKDRMANTYISKIYIIVLFLCMISTLKLSLVITIKKLNLFRLWNETKTTEYFIKK